MSTVSTNVTLTRTTFTMVMSFLLVRLFRMAFIKTRLFPALAACLLFTPVMSQADNTPREETFGDYTVHYNAFNSTFLQPEVAKRYNIERAPREKLINISILKNGKPVKAEVKVETSNLMAQKTDRKTQQINDGDAVYYIASFSIVNDELLHFTIKVTPEDSKQSNTITFSQKFYEE